MTTITKAGRYELREELGRGAMGVVYRAQDPVIGRDVAVKTIHLSEAGTGMSRAELVGRFQTEARAAGLLTHPNIVVIYDAGEEEGLFYITMELVEGRSLQTMLDAREVFPLSRVMRLMEQVCSALDFAHQHNVVHRDIKPANLVLTKDDTVKITDFGTAKILQFGTAQTAHVMGTPSYMSPEQVKGKPVDGRSDIFSLGVILYELMTGEKPFPGQNITTVIYKIINEEPIPPRELDSSIHQGLSAVITRALAKDPEARFQTCQELLNALKNYHDIVGTTTRMSPGATQRVTKVAARPATAGRAALAGATTATPETEKPIQVVSAATLQAEASSKKRVNALISVALLGVIGFAGYRIWAPMVDLWQRARESSAVTPAAQSQAAPVAPVAGSAAPEVKADSKPEVAATPTQSMQKPAVPSLSSSPSPVEPASSGASAAKPLAPQKPEPAGPSNTTVAAEKRLKSELATLSVSDRVKVQMNGNALTLSGRVTPAEHLKLLNALHWVPATVRIVDDLEYSSDQN